MLATQQVTGSIPVRAQPWRLLELDIRQPNASDRCGNCPAGKKEEEDCSSCTIAVKASRWRQETSADVLEWRRMSGEGRWQAGDARQVATSPPQENNYPGPK